MSSKQMNKDTQEDTPENEQEQQTPTGDGVTVSEDFQRQAHQLTHKATKHELNHLSDKVSSRNDELRKAEMKEEQKGKKGPKVPAEYSTASAPPGVEV